MTEPRRVPDEEREEDRIELFVPSSPYGAVPADKVSDQPGETVTRHDIARYRRTHLPGTPGNGWDVEDRDDATEAVR